MDPAPSSSQKLQAEAMLAAAQPCSTLCYTLNAASLAREALFIWHRVGDMARNQACSSVHPVNNMQCGRRVESTSGRDTATVIILHFKQQGTGNLEKPSVAEVFDRVLRVHMAVTAKRICCANVSWFIWQQMRLFFSRSPADSRLRCSFHTGCPGVLLHERAKV